VKPPGVSGGGGSEGTGEAKSHWEGFGRGGVRKEFFSATAVCAYNHTEEKGDDRSGAR